MADACHPHGTLVLAGLGPRRRPGVERLLAVGAVGPVAGGRRGQPRDAGGDGAGRDRRAWSTGFAAAARLAVDVGPRRGGDRRRLHSRSCASSTPGSPTCAPTRYGTDRLRPDPRGARRRPGRRRAGPVAVPAAVLRRAGPVGRGDPRAGRRPGGRAGRAGRPRGGGPRRPVLGLRLPSRRPHPGRASISSLCRQMRQAAAGRAAVVLQGSVVDPGMAQARARRRGRRPGRDDPGPDRRPRLVAWSAPARAGSGAALHPLQPGLPRPRQPQPDRELRGRAPQRPRDGRADPDGERTEVDVRRRPGGRGRAWPASSAPGSWPAGATGCGWSSASDRPGGALRAAAVGPGRQRLAGLADWLTRRVPRLGGDHRDRAGGDRRRPRRRPRTAGRGGAGHRGRGRTASTVPVDGSCPVVDAADACSTGDRRASPTDRSSSTTRSGGPIGVGVAEWLAGAGREVSLVTPDQIAGTLLSLHRGPGRRQHPAAAGRRAPRAAGPAPRVGGGQAVLEDVWTGERRTVPCAVLVDCGHRLPDESLYLARPGTLRAGDCVAPAECARGRARRPSPGPGHRRRGRPGTSPAAGSGLVTAR